MTDPNESCQGVHPDVVRVSSKPPRMKRVYWHLRQHGVLWASQEALRRVRRAPPPQRERVAARSPAVPLNLKAGDWVEVRSESEIRDLLDSDGRTTGLTFMPEMWRFCGGRFRVRTRLDRFISEATGELRSIRHTVLLDDVICDGSEHMGCQRSCFLWWREAWLKRVQP